MNDAGGEWHVVDAEGLLEPSVAAGFFWTCPTHRHKDYEENLAIVKEKVFNIERLSNSDEGHSNLVLDSLIQQDLFLNRKLHAGRKKLVEQISSQLTEDQASLSLELQLAFSALLNFLDSSELFVHATVASADDFGATNISSHFSVGGSDVSPEEAVSGFYQFIRFIRECQPNLTAQGPQLILSVKLYHESANEIEYLRANILTLNICREVIAWSPWRNSNCHVRLFDIHAGGQPLPKNLGEAKEQQYFDVSVSCTSHFPWGKEARDLQRALSNESEVEQGIENPEDACFESAMPAHDETKHIFLIGQTGVGKSTLGNILCGDDSSFSTNLTETGTTFPEGVIVSERSCLYHRKMRIQVWDTPGLDDSEGRDQIFLKDMRHVLERCESVAAVLLCVRNSNRLAASLKKAIRMYRGIFGSQLSSILKVVITESGANYSEKEKEDIRTAWVRNVRTSSNLVIGKQAVLFLPIDESPMLPYIPDNISPIEAPSYEKRIKDKEFFDERSLWKARSIRGIQPTRHEAKSKFFRSTLRGLIADIWISAVVSTNLVRSVRAALEELGQPIAEEDKARLIQTLQRDSRELLSHLVYGMSVGCSQKGDLMGYRIKILSEEGSWRERTWRNSSERRNIQINGVVFKLNCPQVKRAIVRRYRQMKRGPSLQGIVSRLQTSSDSERQIITKVRIELLASVLNDLGFIVCKRGTKVVRVSHREEKSDTIVADFYEVIDPLNYQGVPKVKKRDGTSYERKISIRSSSEGKRHIISNVDKEIAQSARADGVDKAESVDHPLRRGKGYSSRGELTRRGSSIVDSSSRQITNAKAEESYPSSSVSQEVGMSSASYEASEHYNFLSNCQDSLRMCITLSGTPQGTSGEIPSVGNEDCPQVSAGDSQESCPIRNGSFIEGSSSRSPGQRSAGRHQIGSIGSSSGLPR